ncbi:GNAT family N-acetyltransferase [Paenibacillus sp. WLX1005]|uniref:GNAT family N-acetyltransferase n=1 Tax=Paenibacillus sp. WLX1005 TaxID=3243766 RepID=UPI003983F727
MSLEMHYSIQPITELPNDLLLELVPFSEQEGYRHIRRLYDDYVSGSNTFSLPGEILYGAYADQRLIGICGLNRDPHAGQDGVGRVRRMYVHPQFRRYGIGGALLAPIMEHARQHYRLLVLYTPDVAAGMFYESLGFQRTEDTTQWNYMMLL